MKQFLLMAVAILSVTLSYAQVTVPVKKTNIAPPDKKIAVALNTVTVKLDDFVEELCPKQLLRGDREFNGNGPKVKCEVKIKISSDSTKLIADFYLWAQETQSDWSTGEGRWSRLVYEAPYGTKINRILSDAASRTQFISPKAGAQILVPGADVAKVMYTFFDYTDVKSAVLKAYGYGPEDKSILSKIVKVGLDHGNTIVQVPPVDGTLVKYFHIVGDTGGDDISDDDNCNDDTRISKIEFFPVKLELRRLPR
ncbi:MAG: hypothetical protein U0T11_02420 [Chitinophagaceae bacterium]